MAKENGNILHAGTIQWDTDKVHNKSRYVAYANAKPSCSYTKCTPASQGRLITQITLLPAVHLLTLNGIALYSQAIWYKQTLVYIRLGDLFWDEYNQRFKLP